MTAAGSRTLLFLLFERELSEWPVESAGGKDKSVLTASYSSLRAQCNDSFSVGDISGR